MLTNRFLVVYAESHGNISRATCAQDGQDQRGDRASEGHAEAVSRRKVDAGDRRKVRSYSREGKPDHPDGEKAALKMDHLTGAPQKHTVQNNSAPEAYTPEALDPASTRTRPRTLRAILSFPSQSVKSPCRRPVERITMAAGGYSHHGIALRSDKAGEGSGRGRKATGHTRLRLRCVLKATPNQGGMARLAHQPRSTLRTFGFDLERIYLTGFDFKKCRQAFSGLFLGEAGA